MSAELRFFKIQWDLLGKLVPEDLPPTFEPEAGLPAIRSMLIRSQGGSKDASAVRNWCLNYLYSSFRRIEILESSGAAASDERSLIMSALPQHIRQLPMEDRIKCIQTALAPKSVCKLADEAFKGHVYASLPQAIRDLPVGEQVSQIQKFFAGEPVTQSLETLNDAAAFRSLKARLIESKQFTQAQMDSEPLDVLFSRALRDTSTHDAETKILTEETARYKRLAESRLTLYNDAMGVMSTSMALLTDYTGALPTRVKAVLRDAQKVKGPSKEVPVIKSPSEVDPDLQMTLDAKEIERLKGEVYLGNQETKRMTDTITNLNAKVTELSNDLSHSRSTCKVYYTGWKRAEKAAEHASPEGLTRLAAMLARAQDQHQLVTVSTKAGGVATEENLLDAVEGLLRGWRVEVTPQKEAKVVTTPTVREDLVPQQPAPKKVACEEAPDIIHKMVGLLSGELRRAASNPTGAPIQMVLSQDGRSSTADFSDARVFKCSQACRGIVFKPGEGTLDPAIPVVDMNSLVLVAAWKGQAPTDWNPQQPCHMFVAGPKN